LNKIEKLIQIIENDIDLVNQGIQKDNQLLFLNIEKDKHMLFLSNYFFIDLINKYCYQPLPKDYDDVKGYVPDNRLELFERIFLSKVKKSELYCITYVHGFVSIKSVELLYISLFLTIYVKTLITSLEIEVIFKRLLADWKFFLEKQKIPIQIITFLPEVFIEQEVVRLSNNFEIRSIPSIIFYEKTGPVLNKSFEVFGPIGSFLFFTTDLSCNHNFLENLQNNESKELNEEWTERMKSLKELILSLLLGGIHFTDESTDILFPWWFGDQTIKFQKQKGKIRDTIINDKDLKEINELYTLVNKLNLIDDKELELALHKYILLLKRDYLYDIILDEFIILEFIFTKGSTVEVTFRLSSNLAFFLAKDIEEFKRIYNFIKDFYVIRSKIAHGEDWTSGLSKEKYRKHLGIDDPNTPLNTIVKEIVSKLRDFIDKTLRKIIEMKHEMLKKGESPNIMNSFVGTFFIENSYLNFKEKLLEE